MRSIATNQTPVHPRLDLWATSWFVLISIIVVSSNIHAQQSKIDSLHQVLRSNSHDTTRVNALNELASEILSSNPDSAISTTDKALDLSRRIGFKKGEGTALYNIGKRHKREGDYGQALETYQKSLQIHNSISYTGGMAVSLNEIGLIHWRQGRYEQAIESFQQSLKIHEESGYLSGVAKTVNNIGLVYSSQGDYEQALKYYHRTLKLLEELEDKTGIAGSLANIGVIYQSQGRYERALEYYQRSLRLLEELGFKLGVARVLNNIGIIHKNQGRYEQALESYQKSLAIREVLDNQHDVASMLNNIAVVYKLQAQYDRALEHHKKSMKISQELGNQKSVAVSLRNIGNIHQIQDRHAQALDYYRRSLNISEEIGDKSGKAHSMASIGRSYLHLNKLNDAATMTESAYTIAEEIGEVAEMRAAAEILSDVYQQKGNYRNAYKYHKVYATLQDSLINEENLKSINEMAAKYEAEKRDQQIALLEKDKRLQAAQLEQESMMRYFFIAGLAVLLILAFLLYNRYRYKKRTGEELQRSYEELKRTQQQLIHAEKMATLGELTAGVAHEIKNPLNFVNNFTSMNKELVEELEEYANGNDDILEVAELLKGNTAKILEHGTRADSIVQGMLMHSRETKGVRQQADINDLVKEAVALAEHGSPTGKGADVTLNLSDATGSAEVLPAEISRVILNLVGNSSYAVKKHADDTGIEPEITVSTERVDNTVRIVVADNGPGIAPDVREKIFQPFFTTKPTGDGTGLGLSLSWDIIVNGHNGTIEVESEEGKGARFIVELPAEA